MISIMFSARSVRRWPRACWIWWIIRSPYWLSSPIEAAISFESSTEMSVIRSEIVFTSPATTAKATPACPAREASMRALSARIFVWRVTRLIEEILRSASSPTRRESSTMCSCCISPDMRAAPVPKFSR